MDDPDVESPPLPQPSARRFDGATGCVVTVCVVAMLLFLYVGSFVYVLLDDRYEWGFVKSLDGPGLDVLETVYWPLLWVMQAAMAMTSN